MKFQKIFFKKQNLTGWGGRQSSESGGCQKSELREDHLVRLHGQIGLLATWTRGPTPAYRTAPVIIYLKLYLMMF